MSFKLDGTRFKAWGDDVLPLVGGLLYTYVSGTTTPKPTYTDYTLGSANTNPIVLDARGEADVWMGSGAYTFVLKTAVGVTIDTVDGVTDVTGPVQTQIANLISDLANTGDSTKGDALLGVNLSVFGSVGTTQNQVNSERISVFRFFTAAQIAAVTAGVGGSDAIVADAIQKAMDSGYAEIFFPNGMYLLDKPLLVKSGGTQNLTLLGESRVGTLIQPATVDIKTVAQGINSLIINQNNDGKFSLKRLRFQSNLAYTGVVLYCKEGGGTDGSAQCIFSGSIEECWFSLATPNTGMIRGGLQNFRILNNTVENAKGFLLFDGVGTHDVLCDNNAMFNCYDGFIEAKLDSVDRRLVTVTNLNVYGHLRGAVINANNARGWTVINVNLLGNDTTAPTNMGLFDFANSSDLKICVFGLESVAPYGLAESAIVIDGVSGNFSEGKINGANYGITINGTASSLVNLTNVDISSSRSNALRTTGATTGRLVKTGGNWNSSQGSLVVNSVVAGAFDMSFISGRLVNAGLAGGVIGSASRILDLNTSGSIRLNGVLVGKTNAGAIADYYIALGGSGTAQSVNTEFVGTPPLGVKTGAQTLTYLDGPPPSVEVITSAGAFTPALTTGYVICSAAGTITVTLPSAHTGPITLTTETNQAVISASANVIQGIGGAASNAILSAAGGAFAKLVRVNSTTWHVVETS